MKNTFDVLSNTKIIVKTNQFYMNASSIEEKKHEIYFQHSRGNISNQTDTNGIKKNKIT